jgi:uncharacterized protein with PIN domain
MAEVPGAGPPLMADNMLGTLAKWLRVAGSDCAYADGMEDDELVEVAASGRTVLTRDKVLAGRCGDAGLYVTSDVLEQQLHQVLRTLPDLMGLRPLSRCLVCNVPVEDATAGDVAGDVPEEVLGRHEDFRRCPRCGRVYWEGSHVDDMLSRLRVLMDRVRTEAGLDH